VCVTVLSTGPFFHQAVLLRIIQQIGTINWNSW